MQALQQIREDCQVRRIEYREGLFLLQLPRNPRERDSVGTEALKESDQTS